MRSVSAQWGTTITQSHKRWVRVSSYYGGVKTGEPPVVDGNVTFDASATGARRCSVTVPLVDNEGVSWNPGVDRTAPLASNGQRLLIESGLYHPDHTLEWVSLGWYVITESAVDEAQGTLTVTGSDLWTLLEAAPILRNTVSMRIPSSRTGGIRANQAVDALLYPRLMAQPFPSNPAWPTESQIIPQDSTSSVLPPVVGGPAHSINLIQGDSRTQAILNVYDYWGVNPRVDDAGNLANVPLPLPVSSSDPADIELTDANGTNPVLVDRAYASDRTKLYNCVVVFARSSTTGETLFTANTQYNTGALSAQGPLGYRPKFIETTFATTQAAADAISQANLARSVLYAITQSLTCVPNAAIELDDVVLVDTAASGTFKGRVTQITLPLLSTGPMTLGLSNQTEDAAAFAALAAARADTTKEA